MNKEQTICINCGFCCDGTLFSNAVLELGEKGNLPVLIERGYIKKNDGEYFQLPCSYFNGKCSIYDQHKAHICSAFRCQLLKTFAADKVSFEEAQSIVKNAKKLREDVLNSALVLFPEVEGLHFRELLDFLFKKSKQFDGKVEPLEFKILLGKCNLLETLLIKYFKSSSSFDKMILEG